MNKGAVVAIVIAAVLLLLGGSLIGSYNGLVDSRENINNKRADIDAQLERRADLIPNLVSTVKGYTSHETEAIEKVTKARENLLKANGIQEKAEENERLTEAIDALMVIVENYPELKADGQFTKLQDELAGTENRIAIARKDYNEAVKNYNSKIKRFPTNIIASIFNFEEETYFEAKESANKVPEVDFE